MEVVLRMTADEFLVLREDDVAFDDAGAHSGRGLIGLARMLGKLHRGAAVADGEVAAFERTVGAGEEGLPKGAVRHVVHEEKGSRAQLDAVAAAPVVVRSGLGALSGIRRGGRRGDKGGK